MPSPLGFFAEVVRTGTVLGIDVTLTPDQVTRAFGVDPGVNLHEPHLWHDYGLVEFFWERAADGRWRGTHFSVQVHRLDDGIGYEIPQAVAEYGTAPHRVAFDALAAELTAPLVAIKPWDDDLYAYWQPDSTAVVTVVSENPSPTSNASTVPPGHVYQISAPHLATHVERWRP